MTLIIFYGVGSVSRSLTTLIKRDRNINALFINEIYLLNNEVKLNEVNLHKIDRFGSEF